MFFTLWKLFVYPFKMCGMLNSLRNKQLLNTNNTYMNILDTCIEMEWNVES